jgi:putative ABC transport system permease protein
MEKVRLGGFGTLMKIAFRNIFRNKRRTAFCLIAVGLAVFLIAFYGSMIAGMLGAMNEAVQIFETGHVRAVSRAFDAEAEAMPVQFPVGEGRPLSELEAAVAAIPGVASVFPRIKTYATLQESVLKHATLWGLRMEGEAKAHHFNLTDRGDGLLEGRYPAPGANECAVGRIFADKTGLGVGDRIPLKTVSAQFSDRIWAPKVVGVFFFDYTAVDRDAIIVDFERLQRLLTMGDAAQQLVVYTDDPALSAPVARQMEELLGADNIAEEWQDNYWVALMNGFMPIYYVVYLVFLVVASFLIVNTVVMIIHERIKEIGMMGSLGMSRREIVTVFFFESVFLAVLGATAGMLAGGVLTAALQNTPINLMGLMGDTFAAMPMGNALYLTFSPALLAQSWLLGVGIATLFTLFPSLKSAFVEPVEALRR